MTVFAENESQPQESRGDMKQKGWSGMVRGTTTTEEEFAVEADLKIIQLIMHYI